MSWQLKKKGNCVIEIFNHHTDKQTYNFAKLTRMNSRVWIDKRSLSKWVGISHRDESSLLQKYIQTNDLRYLLELYQPYMHLVYGLAYTFVQDSKQSQEIVYCIFKKLIKEVRHQEIRVFSSWLYNVTRQFCKQWRSRGRSEVDEIVALGGTTQTPITFYDDDDNAFEKEIISMEEEIENLKNQQDRCADLFFNQQKCFHEIAAITGWDLAVIKRHIRNAKKRANIYQE
jgi:RNA polymerase sigma-70 factor (ECF subfamily)